MKIIKQVVVILMICVITENAFSLNENFIQNYALINNEFKENPKCQTLAIPFSPYFILNSDLSNTHNFLKKGSFVDYNRKKIIRSWNSQEEESLNISLPDSLLDAADQWKIKVLSTKDESLPFSLAGKTLELQKKDTLYIVQNCCTDSSCQVLPFYKVYENKKWIASLSFHPKKSDFIESYSLIKGTETMAIPNSLIIQSKHSKNQSEVDQNLFPFSSEVSTVQRQYQNIVCTRSEPLKIYDDTFKSVVYRIQRFQSIQVFQGWDGKNIEKWNGSVRLLKVQAENAKGEEINGWAAANYIKKPDECDGFSLIGSPAGETLIEGSTIVVDPNPGTYRFPTSKKPIYDYIKGPGHQRYFGAPRNGRLHAAADLFRPKNENIYAVANGTILRKYYFYSGTYAIEVKHDTGPVIRYGEVSGKNVPLSNPGQRVIKGQHLSFIGHLGMLHFEMYSDTKPGPLTQRGHGAYSRRSDLLNPTSYLKTWENETF